MPDPVLDDLLALAGAERSLAEEMRASYTGDGGDGGDDGSSIADTLRQQAFDPQPFRPDEELQGILDADVAGSDASALDAALAGPEVADPAAPTDLFDPIDLPPLERGDEKFGDPARNVGVEPAVGVSEDDKELARFGVGPQNEDLFQIRNQAFQKRLLELEGNPPEGHTPDGTESSLTDGDGKTGLTDGNRPSLWKRLTHGVRRRAETIPRVWKDFGVEKLRNEVIEMETNYRLKTGKYSPTDVQVLRGSRRPIVDINRQKIRQRVMAELDAGMPMSSRDIITKQHKLYQAVRDAAPNELPEARGMVEKAIEFAGDIAPLVAASVLLKRPLGAIGVKGAAATGTVFGLDTALAGGDAGQAAQSAATGVALGGVTAGSRALAGKIGVRPVLAQGVGTGAFFGGLTAAEGGDVEDVLIAGVVAPLLFHAKDIARFPFRPRQLGRPTKTKAERDDVFIRSKNITIKLADRLMRMSQDPMTIPGELKGAAKVFQGSYATTKKGGFRGMSASERTALEDFVAHYDPAIVGKRTPSAAGAKTVVGKVTPRQGNQQRAVQEQIDLAKRDMQRAETLRDPRHTQAATDVRQAALLALNRAEGNAINTGQRDMLDEIFELKKQLVDTMSGDSAGHQRDIPNVSEPFVTPPPAAAEPPSPETGVPQAGTPTVSEPVPPPAARAPSVEPTRVEATKVDPVPQQIRENVGELLQIPQSIQDEIINRFGPAQRQKSMERLRQWQLGELPLDEMRQLDNDETTSFGRRMNIQKLRGMLLRADEMSLAETDFVKEVLERLELVEKPPMDPDHLERDDGSEGQLIREGELTDDGPVPVEPSRPGGPTELDAKSQLRKVVSPPDDTPPNAELQKWLLGELSRARMGTLDQMATWRRVREFNIAKLINRRNDLALERLELAQEGKAVPALLDEMIRQADLAVERLEDVGTQRIRPIEGREEDTSADLEEEADRERETLGEIEEGRDPARGPVPGAAVPEPKKVKARVIKPDQPDQLPPIDAEVIPEKGRPQIDAPKPQEEFLLARLEDLPGLPEGDQRGYKLGEENEGYYLEISTSYPDAEPTRRENLDRMIELRQQLRDAISRGEDGKVTDMLALVDKALIPQLEADRALSVKKIGDDVWPEVKFHEYRSTDPKPMGTVVSWSEFYAEAGIMVPTVGDNKRHKVFTEWREAKRAEEAGGLAVLMENGAYDHFDKDFLKVAPRDLDQGVLPLAGQKPVRGRIVAKVDGEPIPNALEPPPATQPEAPAAPTAPEPVDTPPKPAETPTELSVDDFEPGESVFVFGSMEGVPVGRHGHIEGVVAERNAGIPEDMVPVWVDDATGRRTERVAKPRFLEKFDPATAIATGDRVRVKQGIYQGRSGTLVDADDFFEDRRKRSGKPLTQMAKQKKRDEAFIEAMDDDGMVLVVEDDGRFEKHKMADLEKVGGSSEPAPTAPAEPEAIPELEIGDKVRVHGQLPADVTGAEGMIVSPQALSTSAPEPPDGFVAVMFKEHSVGADERIQDHRVRNTPIIRFVRPGTLEKIKAVEPFAVGNRVLIEEHHWIPDEIRGHTGKIVGVDGGAFVVEVDVAELGKHSLFPKDMEKLSGDSEQSPKTEGGGLFAVGDRIFVKSGNRMLNKRGKVMRLEDALDGGQERQDRTPEEARLFAEVVAMERADGAVGIKFRSPGLSRIELLDAKDLKIDDLTDEDERNIEGGTDGQESETTPAGEDQGTGGVPERDIRDAPTIDDRRPTGELDPGEAGEGVLPGESPSGVQGTSGGGATAGAGGSSSTGVRPQRPVGPRSGDGPNLGPRNQPGSATPAVGGGDADLGSGDTGGSGVRGGESAPSVGEGTTPDIEQHEQPGPAAAAGVTATAPGGGGSDYVIAPGESVFDSSERRRVRANLDAIRVLNEITEANRPATPEEQRVLVQYTGTGSNREMFSTRYSQAQEWEAEMTELESLVTESELDDMAESNPNAMYTPPEIVRAMWEAVRHMGFEGGSVLEPAIGVGHFFGAMPPELRPTTRRIGGDMDAISARISKLLYPNSDVRHTAFQEAVLPNGFFDAVVSNFPFGAVKVFDRRYPKRLRSTLHDYFFVRSLDLVKPGGLVVSITSKGMMDKLDSSIRRWLSERADFLGAVRLNDSMLAGTKVTADIIFLRARDKDTAPGGIADWIESNETEVPHPDVERHMVKRNVNQYFLDHPEQVLGEIVSGSQYTAKDGPTNTIVRPKSGLTRTLAEALEVLPTDGFQPSAVPAATIRMMEQTLADPDAPDTMPVGALVFKDGKLHKVSQTRHLFPIEDELFKAGKAQGESQVRKARLLVRIRDAVLALQRAMLNPASTEQGLKHKQAELNRIYDAFVRREGGKTRPSIHNPANLRAIRDDMYTTNIVRAVEKVDKETKQVTKGDIFTKRVLEPPQEERAESLSDATAIMLSETGGGVSVTRVAEILGSTPEAIREKMLEEGLIYEEPSGALVIADEYLSGDVREKLRQVEAAIGVFPLETRFDKNRADLLKVLPPDLTPAKIGVGLASNWVPLETLRDFTEHLLGRRLKVQYVEVGAKWLIEKNSPAERTVAATDTWGTKDLNAVELMRFAFNMKQPVVWDDTPVIDAQGNTRRVHDDDATEGAIAKLEDIQMEYKRWLFADARRLAELVPLYNDIFNALVPRQWDGMHMRLPGMSEEWKANMRLREYQMRAVWRAIAYKGNTMDHHATGSGKTIIAVATAMEWKRLGIHKKTVIVVKKQTFGSFPEHARAMYPAARVLALDNTTMKQRGGGNTALGRAQSLTDLAFNDWDIVIMTQETFMSIKMGKESIQNYFDDKIAELEEAILDAAADKDTNVVRELESQKTNLESTLQEKLADLADAKAKSGELTFEEIGIDAVIYDEVHAIKNSPYITKADRVKGMGDKSGSARARDAEMKFNHIRKINNGRGLKFMSATPVANTAVEVAHFMRYLAPELLADMGINHIDAWLNTFGEISEAQERKAEGGYDKVTRLRKFTNLGDMMRIWLSFTDRVSTRELIDKYDLPIPAFKKNSEGNRNVEMHILPKTEQMQRFVDFIERYADYIKGNFRAAQANGDNFLKLSTMMREGAVDVRLQDAQAVDESTNKAHAIAKDVGRIYKETTGYNVLHDGKTIEQDGIEHVFPPVTIEMLDGMEIPHDNGKVNGVQLVFANVGVNVKELTGYHFYADLVNRIMEQGIPRKEIAVIGDYNTNAKLEMLFVKVNKGEVRVLIGSMQKMGVGVNVQRLVAGMHGTDPPQRPDWLEQAEGRGFRHRNLFPEIEMHLYAGTSMDEKMFSDLQLKRAMTDAAMDGDLNTREMEEITTEQMRYSDLKALTSENPYVLKVETAKRKVQKLTARRGAFQQQQVAMANELKYAEGEQRGVKQAISFWDDFIKRVPQGKDNFSLKIGNREYADDRAAAGELLKVERDKHQAELDKIVEQHTTEGMAVGDQTQKEITIDWKAVGPKKDAMLKRLLRKPAGTMRGVPFYWTAEAVGRHAYGMTLFFQDRAAETAGVGMNGALSPVDTFITEPFSATGLIQRLDNRVGRAVAQREKVENRLVDVTARVEELLPLMDRQFAGDQAIKDAEAELEELEARQLAHGKDRPSRRAITPTGTAPTLFGAPEEAPGITSSPSAPFPPAQHGSRFQGRTVPLGLLQHLSPEQRRYIGTMKSSNPIVGMGAMGNIPDARGIWKRSIDAVVDRLENLPPSNRRNRLIATLARGLYGDQWGISEDMYRFFSQVQGRRKLAQLDADVASKFIAERIEKYARSDAAARPDSIRTADDADYFDVVKRESKRWERVLQDVFEGKKLPSVLDEVDRQFYEKMKGRIDALSDELLQYSDDILNAFGLRNFRQVVMERMKAPGTYLRALYEPRQQTVATMLSGKGKVVEVLRGPRIKGGAFKIRRSDKGIPGVETWTLQHPSGTEFTQYFDQDEAIAAYQAELDKYKDRLGQSRFDRIKLLDPFDREMMQTQTPVTNLAKRLTNTLVTMEHNLATLKLFDMIATTHALPNVEGPDSEPPRPDMVLLPDNPTFGMLRNQWVDQHVYRNLMAYQTIHRGFIPQAWNTFNYMWKSSKTAFNPPTWVNNVLGNLFFAAIDHMDPVRHWKWYVAAAKEIANKGPHYRALLRDNRINVGFAHEMGVDFDAKFKEHYPDFPTAFGKWTDSTVEKLRKAGKFVGTIYDWQDQIFLMASYLRKRGAPKTRTRKGETVPKWNPLHTGGKGMTHDAAIADLWMYTNYARIGDYARWARIHPAGSSFMSFIDNSLKINMRAMRDRPGTLLALYAIPGLIGMIAGLLLGISDEEMAVVNEDSSRKGHPGPDRFFNTYFQPIIPWRDEDGKLQSIDLRWKFPFANEFRVQSGNNGIGVPFIFNTPAVDAVVEAMAGVSLYTGRRVTDEDGMNQAKLLFEHLMNAGGGLLPIPNMASRTFTNVYRTFLGDSEDTYAAAVAKGVFGLKLKTARPRRAEVLRIIQEQLGDDAHLQAEKMINLYNDLYRYDLSRPISPRSAIRGKVMKEVNKQRREDERARRRRRNIRARVRGR